MTVANTTFNDLITFTRASTGTFTGTNGLVQTAAIDVPRFDYNPTTLAPLGFLVEEARTNLVTYSEQFDNAAWTKNATSITPDVITSPNGALNADRLVENTATASHSMQQSFSATTGTAVTLSVYVKSTERFAVLGLSPNATFGGTGAGAFFNVSSGAVQNTFGTVTALITAAGNGWYRCSITSTPTATGTANAAIGLSLTGGAQTYTGDGTSGLHFWGAQLETGAFATSYFPTTPTFTSRATTGTFVNSSGLIATAAIDVARNQYNPTNLTAPPFLLLEAAATNLVTYSQDLSNAAWNKGLMTVTGGNTDPFGASTAYLVDTATETGSVFPATGVTVTAPNTYIVSTFVKAGTAPFLRIRTSLSVGSITTYYSIANKTFSNSSAGVVGLSAITLPSGWVRISVSFAYGASDGGTRTISFSPTLDNTGTVGGTVLVWGAQFELGAFATSYITTAGGAVTRAADISTSAAVTRAADEAVINTLSPWYNATEGTLYAKYTTFNVSQINGAVALSDGTNNNRMIIRAANASAQTVFIGVDANVTIWAGIINSALANTVTNTAFAYKLNDIAWARNEGTVGTDSSASIPVVDQLKLGADGNGALPLNGYLQKIIYYPQRLTNSELQALTS